MMRLGPQGKAIIRRYETGGWRDAAGKLHLLARGEPALKAYLCPAGVPTIGWGHTDKVRLGQVITREEAETLFAADVAWACTAVDRATVETRISQEQFDAMVSLTFNIGAANFLGSTVLRRHRAHDYRGAAQAFASWNKMHVGPKLVVAQGLVERRREEADLYLAGSAA